MNLWPSRAPPALARGEERPPPPPAPDVADVGVEDTGPTSTPAGNSPSASNYQLPRRSLFIPQNIPPPAPTPPSQPPPPTPAGAQVTLTNAQSQPMGHQPADSLSLAQLRRIVTEFPRGPTDPIAYDFVYTDQAPRENEIDEWFVYQIWQWARLGVAQRAFERSWEHDFEAGKPWEQVDVAARQKFVHDALDGFKASEPAVRGAHMGKIMYLVLGRWGDTAGGVPMGADGKRRSQTASTASQLQAIKEGVLILAQVGGIEATWESLRIAFEPFWTDDTTQLQPGSLQEAQDELLNLMTIMYITIQEALRSDKDGMDLVTVKLRGLTPSLVDFMVLATSNLRWDDQGQMPQTQVLLLFWKSLLFAFGGMEDIANTKKAVRETKNEDSSKEVITASPLDYHVFRQEITSKYPSYIPPQPKLPLAAEQTSYLPRLPNHPTRDNGSNGILPASATNRNTGGASILHQPVHIATPAPSPPPSPGVGGKGGKKQNYQTNQNFPFMYPPLDATSNSAGGKGIPEALERIIGRRWEGSDIPASILEAGELFATRVRMTRATRQLWEERERFLQFERGWDADDDDDVESFDLDLLTLEERELIGRPVKEAKEEIPDVDVDFGPDPVADQKIRERLIGLEDFYRNGLPHFQSLVIVFHKTILAIVTSLINSPGNAQNPGLINGGQYPNGVPGHNRGQENGNGVNGNQQPELHEPSTDEIDATRTREIAGKAATGIVILLLKWLKLSHVLKFEYITQLLLDANFVPLILKFIAHQDVQYMVDTKTDRIESSFFQYCNLRARASEKPVAPEAGDASSEDDACPPPIKRRRSPDGATTDLAKNEQLDLSNVMRPEVDELGYPVNPLPKEPITDFSWRNFFTLINFLRILQKMCKGKVHRNMLLVQYKSSNILRKALKVPQQDLRLYTLKLFKNQVPYCGRKWRQSNMRVITAVYLHCRPELRDEWLAGSDVDAEVEEAVPLEQALRSLTHFFNSRRYPEKMAAEGEKGKNDVMSGPGGEWGFFVRELEKMDWAWGGGDDEGIPMQQ